MSTNSVQHWQIRKPTAKGTNGVVATQHYAASRVGAEILTKGGNAVDAAIATGLAIGTVEPYMSGIGGGGYMVIYLSESDTTEVLEFGMRAPFASTPDDYPLDPNARPTPLGFFNWPPVVDNRNVVGPLSAAVPGHLKGMGLAYERHATLAWEDLIEPACQLAERGLPIDWYTNTHINGSARTLTQYSETRKTYFRDGFAPPAGTFEAPNHVPLGALATTYRTLQEEGPDSYYTGTVAKKIVADLQEAGSKIDSRDLAEYEAKVVEPLTIPYRDSLVQIAGNLTGGPSMKRALENLSGHDYDSSELSTEAVIAYVEALRETYAYRLQHLGEGAPKQQGSTSHLAFADQFGNVVSLTQTLLGPFGSHIMLPQTGILLNNGMMWFNPEPGHPNSVEGGRRPLSNMCPTIVRHADGSHFGLGACGGRKIMASVFQLISFVTDFKMDLDVAIHAPRIDVSGTDDIWVMAQMPKPIVNDLQKRYGDNVKVRRNDPGANHFALPQIVHSKPNKEFEGGVFIPSPHAQAIAV